jgi:hypothetical protein
MQSTDIQSARAECYENWTDELKLRKRTTTTFVIVIRS